jgi:hypothetical protein
MMSEGGQADDNGPVFSCILENVYNIKKCFQQKL